MLYEVITNSALPKTDVRSPAVTFEAENARIYPYDGVGAALVGFYRSSGGEVHATGREYSLGGYLDGRAGLAQSLVTPEPSQHLV